MRPRKEPSLEPIEYLRALRRRWGVIVSAAAIALLAGFAVTSAAPARPSASTPTAYRATAVLLSDTPGFGAATLNLKTIATLVTIGEVPTRAATALQYQGDPIALAARVQAVAEQDTGLLRISASSRDPEEARTLADTFARELLGFLRDRTAAEADGVVAEMERLRAEIAELDRRILGGPPTQAQVLVEERNGKVRQLGRLTDQYERLVTALGSGSGLRTIQDASPQVLPPPRQGLRGPQSRTAKMAFAGGLGLLAGLGLAFLLERVDTRIRTKQAAESHFRLPVLAEIPFIPRRRHRRDEVQVVARPRSAWADAFRLLSAGVSRRLWGDGDGAAEGGASRAKAARPLLVAAPRPALDALALNPNSPARTILVTSAGAGEGKTTVVANLAGAFAEHGKKVLIVSCDFRRPRVHEMLGVPNVRGLAEALRSRVGEPILEGIVRETLVRGVRLVPSGPAPAKPSELLGSENMRRALAEARRYADVIILDTAPVFSSDATHLIPEVEAVLVVARAGKTKAEQAERSSEILKSLGAPVVGLALTGIAEPGLHRGHYLYYQGAEGETRRRFPSLPRFSKSG